MNETPKDWIDILSDLAVTLAAHAWHKDKAETWGILSRAIQRQDISQHMPAAQVRAYIKLIADPEFFKHCPVCKTSASTIAVTCSNCRVDLEIARNNLIEEEFKIYNFPLEQITAPPDPVTPKPYPLATLFLTLANLTSIIGGILALLYSLYVVTFLFGWVNAILALIVFPLTYTLLPFYILFTYGDLTLLIANYGVGILAFILSYIAHRLEETRPKLNLTLSSVLGTIAFCFFSLLAYGWIKDTLIMPLIYLNPSNRQPIATPKATIVPAVQPAKTPTPKSSCLLWSQVTPQMEGKTICVYGTVLNHTEDWDNELTRFYFGTQEQFFLVSNYRWATPYEGKCVTTTGKILLNTYNIPYIKIADFIDSCQ